MQNFEDTPLASFKDLNSFHLGWKDWVEKITQTPGKRHTLRLNLMRKHGGFDEKIMNGKASIQIDDMCTISKEHIDQRDRGIWFSGCATFHRFSADTVYKEIQKSKGQPFPCPECKVPVRSLKDFQLDIILFQYFSIVEIGQSKLEIEAKVFVDRSEAAKQDNETDIPGERTIVWLVERLPPEFQKFINSEKTMQTLYEKLRNFDHNEFLNKLTAEEPAGVGNVAVSLLCTATQKRVLFPMMHRDCKHQTISLFDLYSISPKLFKDRASNVPCSVEGCEAKFTFEDIEKKGIFDKTLTNLVRKEPFHYITMFFMVNGQEKKHLFSEQEKYIGNRIPAPLSSNQPLLKQTKKQVKNFFKFNKIQEKKYRDAVTKLMGPARDEVVKCKVPESINTYSVPVRCINCTQLNDVRDLWHYSALLYENNIERSSDTCPICKNKFGLDSAEKTIYIDYRMWEYIKQGFNALVYFPGEGRNQYNYNVDIEEVTHDQLRKLLVSQNRVIKEYEKSTENFTVLVPLAVDDLKSALPLVLRSCREKCKSSKVLATQHMIYKKKQSKLKDISCKICKVAPVNILNVCIDMLMEKVLGKQSLKLDYDSTSGNYILVKKIRDFKSIKDLIAELKSKSRTARLLKQECVAMLVKKKVIGKNIIDDLISYPITIKCQCDQKVEPLRRLHDLEDVFGERDSDGRVIYRIDACPSCNFPLKELTTDDILFIQDYQEQIAKIKGDKKVLVAQYKNGVVIKAIGKSLYSLNENPNTTGRGFGLYENLDPIHVSKLIGNGLTTNQVEELEQIKKRFKKEINALPKEASKAKAAVEVKNQFKELVSAGGANILSGTAIPLFVWSENRS